ncbi:hypothetical protein CLF_104704 [Clonorchis sinensis]|uniref:G-protein coupled receptors family 1 profile domain-containing protein n=1 Tax=Clonorchis sinensis TaxID=79923 RepID=G7YC60_CLOSI|nr:hypothetical protein CLF_104704 [Clonorchis sinensis]
MALPPTTDDVTSACDETFTLELPSSATKRTTILHRMGAAAESFFDCSFTLGMEPSSRTLFRTNSTKVRYALCISPPWNTCNRLRVHIRFRAGIKKWTLRSTVILTFFKLLHAVETNLTQNKISLYQDNRTKLPDYENRVINPSTPPEICKITLTEFILYFCCQPVICLCGFFLNILSVIIFCKPQFSGPAYTYMTAMSMTDAITLLIHIPAGLVSFANRIAVRWSVRKAAVKIFRNPLKFELTNPYTTYKNDFSHVTTHCEIQRIQTIPCDKIIKTIYTFHFNFTPRDSAGFQFNLKSSVGTKENRTNVAGIVGLSTDYYLRNGSSYVRKPLLVLFKCTLFGYLISHFLWFFYKDKSSAKTYEAGKESIAKEILLTFQNFDHHFGQGLQITRRLERGPIQF